MIPGRHRMGLVTGAYDAKAGGFAPGGASLHNRMSGHGPDQASYEAAIKAVETIDACVERVVSRALQLGGRLLVTADHGNCEMMRNPDGSPHTAHTTNLVHFLYVAEDSARFRCENGILADVAPSLLALLGLPQPAEMTGRNLVLPR